MNNVDSHSLEEYTLQISNIYNKSSVSLDEAEQLFIKFIKKLFMRIFNINMEPIVEILDDGKTHGSYNGFMTFRICREQIQNFINGKALDLFETICHELTHFHQKKAFMNINVKNAVMEKDKYLIDAIEGYYDSNYGILMHEVDAFLSQGGDALKMLDSLGIHHLLKK